MTETRTDWRCLHRDPLPEVDSGMSNFDHEVQDGTSEAIADGQHMTSYPGYDFHAYVYLGAEGVYVADVHRYRVHEEFVTAATLEDLMEEVSDRWGYE